MRKKELLEKVERLETKLVSFNEDFNALKENFFKLQKAFGFVNETGKDGIKFYRNYGKCIIEIEYLFHSWVRECETDINCLNISKHNVIENDDLYAIIEFVETFGCYRESKYYKLDKEKKTCTQIPKPACVLEKELAEKEESKKKATSEKKSTSKKATSEKSEKAESKK